MYVSAIFAIVSSIINIIIGLVLLFSKGLNKERVVYALFCFSVSVWLFFTFLMLAAPNDNLAIFWDRLAYVGVSLIAVFMYHFSLIFGRKKDRSDILLWIGYSLGLFFIYLSQTEKFVSGIFRYQWGIHSIAQEYHHYFLVFFSFYILLFFYQIYVVWAKERGLRKWQAFYIFFGFVILALGSLAFLPAYKISMLPISYFAEIIGAMIIAYTILRYRFMDISFVVGRGFVYLATYLTILGTSFVIVAGHGALGYNVPANILWPILLVLGVWAFPNIFSIYEKIAEQYFYYTYYTNQRALSELSRKLNKVLELDDLCQLISQAIMGTMKTANVAIALKTEKNDLVIIQSAGFGKNDLSSFLKNDFLKNYLDETLRALAADDIPSLIASRNSNEYEQRRLNDLREEMNKRKIEICLPLAIEDKLSGIIVLGEKANNEQFLDQDIEMLTALANHSALALQNAQFYSEIKQFGHKLEATVQAKSDQLREANARLEQLDNAKSEFISIASHQLRSPLTVIKGYLSVTMDGDYGAVPPNVLSSLQTAYKANEQLIGFTNDLLDMSRLESGKIEIKPDLTDLATSINIVIDKLSSEAKKVGTELKFLEPTEKLELIKVDKERIEQAIYNIVANAITHTPRGKITIGLEKISKGQRIVIADTGEGVSREDLKNIFNKQPPAGKESANSNIVSGMGLYLAKKMVEMNHGKIKAESKGLGQGSEVMIEIPSQS